MIKMSFYDGTLDRVLAAQIINDSGKPCVYTYGLGYRHPTTYRKPITKDEAIRIIKRNGMLDITEEEGAFHLNEFSANDMW